MTSTTSLEQSWSIQMTSHSQEPHRASCWLARARYLKFLVACKPNKSSSISSMSAGMLNWVAPSLTPTTRRWSCTRLPPQTLAESPHRSTVPSSTNSFRWAKTQTTQHHCRCSTMTIWSKPDLTAIASTWASIYTALKPVFRLKASSPIARRQMRPLSSCQILVLKAILWFILSIHILLPVYSISTKSAFWMSSSCFIANFPKLQRGWFFSWERGRVRDLFQK